MSTTFENAKVGDRCFAPMFGKVDEKGQNTIIESIDEFLRLRGDNDARGRFRLDGSFGMYDGSRGLQELFWSQPTFAAPEQPKRKVTKTLTVLGQVFEDGKVTMLTCDPCVLYPHTAKPVGLVKFTGTYETEE
jgi:hypothetical protein